MSETFGIHLPNSNFAGQRHCSGIQRLVLRGAKVRPYLISIRKFGRETRFKFERRGTGGSLSTYMVSGYTGACRERISDPMVSLTVSYR